MNVVRRAAWPRILLLTATIVYWAILFVGTHLPKMPSQFAQASDKSLHAAAYCVLALLVICTWSLFRPIKWQQVLVVIAILAIYGALDEITQPIVGRHADVRDWLADLAGMATAIVVFVAAAAMVKRPSIHSQAE